MTSRSGSLSRSCHYGMGEACTLHLSLRGAYLESGVRSGSMGHFCQDQAGEVGRLSVPRGVRLKEKLRETLGEAA